MKKQTFLLFTVILLILTACGSGTGNQPGPASTDRNASSAGELPAATQLMIGTLKLEDTANAVTAGQAAELLPLWQTLQVLSTSDTAAAQETEALITQIQETMTPGQMQAITAMNLTRQDMFTAMQAQGLGPASNSAGAQTSRAQNGNSSSNSGRFFGPGGGFPPPDGGEFAGGSRGFGGGQSQNLSADQIATAQVARQAGGGNAVPQPLLNALIEFLKGKVGT